MHECVEEVVVVLVDFVEHERAVGEGRTRKQPPSAVLDQPEYGVHRRHRHLRSPALQSHQLIGSRRYPFAAFVFAVFKQVSQIGKVDNSATVDERGFHAFHTKNVVGETSRGGSRRRVREEQLASVSAARRPGVSSHGLSAAAAGAYKRDTRWAIPHFPLKWAQCPLRSTR